MTGALGRDDRPPLLWINLERADHRRRRMTWALTTGQWSHERLDAIDGRDERIRVRARPDLRVKGNALPGIRRMSESSPFRRTTRAELACLASWQRAVARAAELMAGDDVALIVEDDVGASLARYDDWPVSFERLRADADAAGTPWTAIQLAPINPRARERLHDRWRESDGRRTVAPKSDVRSHGNGAVLLHRRALPHVQRHLPPTEARGTIITHHPWAVRPVADKWLYSMLPPDSVYVSCYPLFCLDAIDSDLHPDHVDRFHRESREVTLSIWERDGLDTLVAAQRAWDEVR